MSYYRRPMGDYKTYGYAGDPGFLSGLWKGVKALGKIALGIPPKAPVGPALAPTIMGGAAGFTGAQFMPGVGLGPQAPGAGARGPSMPSWQPPGSFVPGSQPWAMAPRGYHLAKDGSGRYVRNRRMNIANPRALRRAMRRVQGFEKLAKRTITFTKRVRIKKGAS